MVSLSRYYYFNFLQAKSMPVFLLFLNHFVVVNILILIFKQAISFYLFKLMFNVICSHCMRRWAVFGMLCGVFFVNDEHCKNIECTNSFEYFVSFR